MKVFLNFFLLFLLVTGLSGKTKDPAPESTRGAAPAPSKIVVAVSNKIKIDDRYIENCLQGLRINIELYSPLKIVEELCVSGLPGPAYLNEIKQRYPADGLLILYNLKMQKKAYEVKSKKLYYIRPFHGMISDPPYYGHVPWTNLYIQVTGKWNYYDFNSGNKYTFEIKSKKVFEFDEYVSNIDSLLSTNPDLPNALFYQNGRRMMEKFSF